MTCWYDPAPSHTSWGWLVVTTKAKSPVITGLFLERETGIEPATLSLGS